MKRKKLNNIFSYLILILFAIWVLIPFYWMVSASLKTGFQIFNNALFFTPTFENYQTAFSLYSGLPHSFFNSFIIMIASVICALIFGVPAAYSLARFEFPGRENIAFFILSLRMMPLVVAILPIYLMAAKINMLDNYFTLILVYTLFNLPFVVWMMKGYFQQVPVEIEEAALLDGCSRIRVISFILPLVAPGMAATAIFSSILTWNEFIAALVLTGRHTATIPVELTKNITSAGIKWGELMAGGTIALLPILILAIVIQRHLVRGLTLGGVK